MNRTFGLLAAGLLALELGCGGGQTQEASSDESQEIEPRPGLVARAGPDVPDLPVPTGFKIVESQSATRQGAGVRFIDLTYRGSAKKFDVKRFYESHMPSNGWVVGPSWFVGGKITMEFQKDTERCQIEIDEAGLFSPTRIGMRVWPGAPVRPRSGWGT